MAFIFEMSQEMLPDQLFVLNLFINKLIFSCFCFLRNREGAQCPQCREIVRENEVSAFAPGLKQQQFLLNH